MIYNLHEALKENNVNKIIEIEKKCENELRERIEENGSDFKINRDSFCEGNHITTNIRDILLANGDPTKNMVAAGR